MTYLYCICQDFEGCAFVDWNGHFHAMSTEEVIEKLRYKKIIIENLQLVNGSYLAPIETNIALASTFPMVSQQVRETVIMRLKAVVSSLLGGKLPIRIEPAGVFWKMFVRDYINREIEFAEFFDRAVYISGFYRHLEDEDTMKDVFSYQYLYSLDAVTLQNTVSPAMYDSVQIITNKYYQL
jgi:hypothetical protein